MNGSVPYHWLRRRWNANDDSDGEGGHPSLDGNTNDDGYGGGEPPPFLGGSVRMLTMTATGQPPLDGNANNKGDRGSESLGGKARTIEQSWLALLFVHFLFLF